MQHHLSTRRLRLTDFLLAGLAIFTLSGCAGVTLRPLAAAPPPTAMPQLAGEPLAAPPTPERVTAPASAVVATPPAATDTPEPAPTLPAVAATGSVVHGGNLRVVPSGAIVGQLCPGDTIGFLTREGEWFHIRLEQTVADCVPDRAPAGTAGWAHQTLLSAPAVTIAEAPAQPISDESGATIAPPADAARAQVTNVVDGDTIDVLIDGREVRIRLIGIDTPETVHPTDPVECFGREASTFARELLTNQRVLLEADPSQGEQDRYGRLLRYVWLSDGRLVNQELIAQGYAFEYTYNTPYAYQTQFKEAQRAAREAQLGLWSPTACNGEQKPAEPTPAVAPPAAPAPTPVPVTPAATVWFSSCRSNPGGAPNAPVTIAGVDKRAEAVVLKNVSSEAINLDGWIMCSIKGGQIHSGIGGVLQPGEQRRFQHVGSNIWNNSEPDPGALYDAEGRLVAYWPD